MMRRRLLRCTIAAAALALPQAVAPSPAQADLVACAGSGTMTFTGTSFDISLDIGACVPLAPLTLSGWLTGACGLATGMGVANDSHPFTMAWAGAVLVFAGGVTGALAAPPLCPTTPVAGVLVLHHLIS